MKLTRWFHGITESVGKREQASEVVASSRLIVRLAWPACLLDRPRYARMRGKKKNDVNLNDTYKNFPFL